MNEEKFTGEKLTDLTEEEIKELEEKLRRCAAKIDPGDFEERYQAIKDSLPPKRKPRLRPSFWRFFVPIVSSLCTGALVLGIMLPFVINAQEQESEQYFLSQLYLQNSDATEFYGALGDIGITYNAPSDMTVQNYNIFLTQKNNKIMGGFAEYYMGDESDYYLRVKIFDHRVRMYPDPNTDYNLTYAKNGASIKYHMTEITDPDDPDAAYEYTAFGTYKRQTYTIEYTSLRDDITDVFDEIFV